MIDRGRGGEGGKNGIREQIKALQWRLDRRQGGVGASNTPCCISTLAEYRTIRGFCSKLPSSLCKLKKVVYKMVPIATEI